MKDKNHSQENKEAVIPEGVNNGELLNSPSPDKKSKEKN